jgi:hypothetical protein
MKKALIIFAALLLTVTSCSYKYTPTSSAMINVTDYEIGDLSKLKTGEACMTKILGFPPVNGNTSVIDAMKNGNISKIKMIDSSISDNIFTIKICTVVHGL